MRLNDAQKDLMVLLSIDKRFDSGNFYIKRCVSKEIKEFIEGREEEETILDISVIIYFSSLSWQIMFAIIILVVCVQLIDYVFLSFSNTNFHGLRTRHRV